MEDDRTCVLFVKEPSNDYYDLFSKNGFEPLFLSPLQEEAVNEPQLYNLIQTSPTEEYWAIVSTSQRASIQWKSCYEAVKNDMNETYLPPLGGIRQLECNLNCWRRLYYFVVGSKTAFPLKLINCSTYFEDSGSKIELINRILEYIEENKLQSIAKKKKVLILEGDKNSDYIKKKLLEKDYKSERFQLYKTEPSYNIDRNIEELQRLYKDKIEYVVFFSPSGVDAILHKLKDRLNLDVSRVIAIGRATGNHLEEKSYLKPYEISQKPTPESVLQIVRESERLKQK